MSLSHHEPSRASEIWKHFAGMFGADAVERKFGRTPPPEWEVMLRRLKDYEIDRGVKRLAYSGKAHVPTLPEFARMCREIGGEYDEGPKRIALPPPSTFSGDAYETAANQRLLKFITTLLAKDSKALGQVLPRKRVSVNDKFSHFEPQASQEQTETTGILVAYKKAWAQDMREWFDESTGEIGRAPIEEQERTWNATMERAMSDIRERLAA